jgi:prepilin-type N-terminal cleavage/methylation domain-containing protein
MEARRTNRRAVRPAFTLIELTVVLLILAVMAAIAAPRYGASLANYRVNAAAGRVAGDLRMIRQYARKISQAQTVTFDAAANSYTASTMADVNRRGTGYTVNLWASDYLTDITSVSFVAGTVQFDIYGRPSAAGTVVVTAGGLQRTVQVDEGGNVLTY